VRISAGGAAAPDDNTCGPFDESHHFVGARLALAVNGDGEVRIANLMLTGYGTKPGPYQTTGMPCVFQPMPAKASDYVSKY
jgi:hypothetical protein